MSSPEDSDMDAEFLGDMRNVNLYIKSLFANRLLVIFILERF
jgi:hypothetical protein